MKLLIKLLLFMLLLCPINTFALVVTKGEADRLVSNYMVDANKDKWYVFSVDGKFQHDLLTAKEFMIINSYRGSYLNNSGLEFWTQTSESNGKYYVVSERLKPKKTTQKSNVKVVTSLQKDVIVKGNGSYDNPWYFEDKKGITFNIDSNPYSNYWISTEPCNLNSFDKKNNVIVYCYPGKACDVYLCGTNNFLPKFKCNDNDFNLSRNINSEKNYNYKFLIDNSQDNLSCTFTIE